MERGQVGVKPWVRHRPGEATRAAQRVVAGSANTIDGACSCRTRPQRERSPAPNTMAARLVGDSEAQGGRLNWFDISQCVVCTSFIAFLEGCGNLPLSLIAQDDVGY